MDNIRLTPELMEHLKNVKTVEELMMLASEHGISINKEEAAVYFNKYCAIGEISDDELESVTGGGCTAADHNCIDYCVKETVICISGQPLKYKYVCTRCGHKFIKEYVIINSLTPSKDHDLFGM